MNMTRFRTASLEFNERHVKNHEKPGKLEKQKILPRSGPGPAGQFEPWLHLNYGRLVEGSMTSLSTLQIIHSSLQPSLYVHPVRYSVCAKLSPYPTVSTACQLV